MLSILKKVDFFVVGAQKSGTTALHNYLFNHPDLCLPLRKELHFFDSEEMMKKPQIYRETRYHWAFKNCPLNTLRGEVTPCYMYDLAYIERIHTYNPRSKLIAILRDPALRAYSHWNMQQQKGIESRDFLSAINDELTFGCVDKRFAYLSRGLYFRQIANIAKYFSKGQLLLLLHDNLLLHPLSTLNKIANFLNISPWHSVDAIISHKRSYSECLPKPIELKLRAFFREDLFFLEKLLGEDLPMWK